MELEERVILVTGAARRVGRAIALRLARAGCRLAVHYRHSADEAAATAGACSATGGAAAAFPANLEDPAAAAGLVRDVLARFGRLDVLVNNAAVFTGMRLEDFDLAEWERTLRVNLTAPLVLTQAAAAALREVRGRVVNVCDAAAAQAWRTHLAYGVSKAGLEALTRALARALAPEVNVVGVAPGIVDWPEHYDEQERSRLTARIPLRRAGRPADVAEAVHFLLRDGDYITGAILPIDGGRRLA